MDNIKIVRKLPKSWDNSNKPSSESVFADTEFSLYCFHLYNSLLGIKEFYEEDFNKDDSLTIDDYISFFNNRFEKFLNLSVDSKTEIDEWYKLCQKRKVDIKKDGRFKLLEYTEYRNPKIYKLNKNNETIGFTDDGYNKINEIAKELFIIEKFCAFTTRKFWQNEITNVHSLDINNKFKILVKVVSPTKWRSDTETEKLKEYYNNRIYESASLIDESHKDNLFQTISSDVYSLLIMNCDNESLICASNADNYSEESIDDINPLEYKAVFSSILMQDDTEFKGKNHKLFATAVECETPKNILKNVKLYTEVNLKNPKVVGVIAPNKKSLNYSEKQAKKYNVPMFEFKK